MQSNEALSQIAQVEQMMLDLIGQGTGEAGQAAAYHLSAGGSRIRALLALDAARALARPSHEAIAIAAACELLHNASLIHDDLQDRDVVRRGRDAVWRRYGDAAAICVGDLLLSAAYGAAAKSGASAPALMIRMHQRVAAVIAGQCDDLALQGGIHDSLETYERVARAKSGHLLVLPLELALVLAGREDVIEIAADAGSLFAIGYQIADDLDDVQRDVINEELNIVSVLAAAGQAQPRAVARDLAIRRFREAHVAATSLPDGCGTLLAEQALHRSAMLSASLETA